MVQQRLLSLVFVVGLGACTSDPVSLDGGMPPGLATVGAEGGQVGLGALVLVVPPGALSLETQIRVSEVSNVDAFTFEGEPESTFYRLEPAGLQFVVPAEVRIAAAGSERLHIVWSDPANPLHLAPLETVVQTGVAVANVTHFSVGGLVQRPIIEADGGPDVPDVGPDAGFVDAAEPDTGAPDASVPDAGAPDASAPDATAPDASVPDTGIPPFILPAMLNTPDACLTRTTTLTVQGASVASWALMPQQELQITYGVTPYGNSSFDSTSGVVTFWPTGTLSGYMRGFGVRAALVGGGTVDRVWSFAAPGLGSYVYGFGGPAVFTAASIPDLSRATAANYAVTIAAPASGHTCSGISYWIESTSSCGGMPARPFMTLNSNGDLTVDPGGLVGRVDGTYCIRVHAQQFSSQVYFQSVDYSFVVGP